MGQVVVPQNLWSPGSQMRSSRNPSETKCCPTATNIRNIPWNPMKSHEICLVNGSKPPNPKQNLAAPRPWNDWKIPRTLRSCYERGPRAILDRKPMGFPMKNLVIRHGLYHPMFGLLSIQCFGSFFNENWLLVSQPRDHACFPITVYTQWLENQGCWIVSSAIPFPLVDGDDRTENRQSNFIPHHSALD